MDTLNNSLEGQLQVVCSVLSPVERISAIDTLLKIVQNPLDHPGVEQYRQLRTGNKSFNQRVWRHPSARQFLTSIGWILVEDTLVLPSSDLLQEALVELIKVKRLDQQLIKVKSGFEQQSLSNGNSGVVGGGSKDVEYQERMRKLREVQKKSKEAKKQITDKIRSDRQETDQREVKSSHGKQLNFGANLNRFGDIGVDLNAGGG